ncbi:DUF1372 family protein [Streptococcus suis]|uniref:DUF1372 family protein n=1 Tax=Streptococcus suis TaxID=1307 RepID=UPI001556346F|nr:DUF1372 family protein [Streptococcus suis]MCB2952607.1 DUF1372 family protein [Streptococcus suis]MCK3860651.1 DUF1372 family protein [Streptococcus suis]MCK3906086.1 DUF1372 family protein [Streptococcus suis]MCK3980698.1 DUF1372 family protein [Streptococcus suis]MCK4014146.1 DUF1372 family protein [Streptococcus suis]
MKDHQPFLFFGTLWLIILLAAMLKIKELRQEVAELEAREPVIIYTVDNSGGEMVGTITDKEIIEGRYTVTAQGYGKFLVTKEQYEAIKVGDPIPEYLKGQKQ